MGKQDLKFHAIKNKNNLYGNIIVCAPDLTFMHRTNLNHVQWYLTRDLAEVHEIDDQGNILSIVLKFEPKGRGDFERMEHSGDVFHMCEKQNVCVVSGEQDWTLLTKHHIIPMIYRKWFPKEYKEHNYHDIVLITIDAHYEYERKADILRDQIARELNLPTLNEFNKRKGKDYDLLRLARYLLNGSQDADFDSLIYTLWKFEEKTGIKPLGENLRQYIREKSKELKDFEFGYGKLVYDHIVDKQAFIERWRQHFVDTMKPQFMPKGWLVSRKYITTSQPL